MPLLVSIIGSRMKVALLSLSYNLTVLSTSLGLSFSLYSSHSVYLTQKSPLFETIIFGDNQNL